MARQLEDFPARSPRPSVYPWDQWTNGKTWEVDEDDVENLANFRNYLYRVARRKQMTVHVHSTASTVVFQFTNGR